MQRQISWARLYTATAIIACATHCGSGAVSNGSIQAGGKQDDSLASATCSQPEGCATADGNVQTMQFTPHSALFTGVTLDQNNMDPNNVTNPNTVFDPNTVADPNAMAFTASVSNANNVDPNRISNPNTVGNTNNVGNANSTALIVLDTSASVCSSADQGQIEAEQTRLSIALRAGQTWQLGTYVVGAANANSMDPNQRLLQVGTDPNKVANPNVLPGNPNAFPGNPNVVDPNGLSTDPNRIGDPNAMPGTQTKPVASAILRQIDAKCSSTETTALTGTLKLTAVSATQIRGTYDLTTPRGEKLQGTLDAVSCPAVSRANLTCAP